MYLMFLNLKNKALFFLVLLIMLSCPIYSEIKFKGGFESKLSYTELNPSNYIPNTTFMNFNGHAYIGFISTNYYDSNQFTFTMLPGVKFYNEQDSTKTSFFFREIYFKWDGIMSINVGKRPLSWGVGYMRQYSFFTNDAYAEEIFRYYNTELQKRFGAVLLSMGTAADTTSIDKMEAPTWYAPWFYVQVDNQDYTLISSTNMFYDTEKGYSVKTAFEFQYFLPLDFKIYSTLGYYILSEDEIGGLEEIRYLAGFAYEYFYNDDFFITPSIEYAWEDNLNLVGVGFTSTIEQQLTTSFFVNYQYSGVDNISSPSIFARINWEATNRLAMQFACNYSFRENNFNDIKNLIEVKLVWNT